MKKYLEDLRIGFHASAEELISKAHEVAKTLNLHQEAAEGNERLLRHYVSMGVVDKPAREGRDALYGFRHLVQFVAARRLLAEGLSLAMIAKYTSVVQTDALTAHLEKSDRTSEAELLVAAFQSTVPTSPAPAATSRRSAPSKPLPSIATGMGMVDVIHEMRNMEKRVQAQLQDMHNKMRSMVESAVKNLAAEQGATQFNPDELKLVIAKLASMMDEAAIRFDTLLQKPMQMIEQQMAQQKYMFDEAHRQKEFLERMFGDLLGEQRNDVRKLFNEQAARYQSMAEVVQKANMETQHQLQTFHSLMSEKIRAIEKQLQAQSNSNPHANT